ncbi:MAG: hypothetical protein ABI992_06035 [Chthoniobacterales bacterium]
MKKIHRLLFVLLALLACVSVTDAASKKKKEAPAKSHYTTISSVSPTSITISENGANKTFAITQFTEILLRGQRTTIAALQPGMSVSVTLAGDQSKASRINASDPPATH